MKNSRNGRMIVVSNRLPVVIQSNTNKKYELQKSSGGLVTAMTPVLKNRGGIWIGWGGNYAEEDIDLQTLLDNEAENLNYKYRCVDISLNDYKLYYKGFSNEVLWPLFHNVSLYCNFKKEYYAAFEKVNQTFAKAVMRELTKEDFIWIHDYHLINTGMELRKEGVDNKIAFFLHIPFPPAQTFNRLPDRLKIINALLSYDLIGFQTETDRKNFLEVIALLTKYEVIRNKRSKIDTVISQNGTHNVGVFPISIDYSEFHDNAKRQEVLTIAQEIKEGFNGKHKILGIDRLDYSKGIPHKLRAYRLLLERNPSLHTKVKLIQIMVPSREDIVKYTSLKKEIEELVGQINGKYSQVGWIPVQYYYHSLSKDELLAYYSVSDIALITPLIDGMNLVAKEYCAANIEKNGVLILSEFAGTSQQFKDDALLINPFAEESIANAIEQALSMEDQEKQTRMQNMQNKVQEFDIFFWVDSFLNALDMQPSNKDPITSVLFKRGVTT